MDDTRCYWIAISASFAAPVDHARRRAQRLETYALPDCLPRRNSRNEYGSDPDEQAGQTYTGMGHDINTHNQWEVESQGAIQDRTRENLASTDKAIAANRRLLLRAMTAVEEGRAPMMALDAGAAAMTGPAPIDAMAPTEGWEEHWRAAAAHRRAAAPWSAPALAAE
ncbi:hypothetical protein ACFQX4_00360 [Roseomonas sp. GCM10028921]